MKKYNLTKEDTNLIEIAKVVIRKNRVENSALSFSVGAALIANNGKIYKGVNIESKSSGPTSICGEMGAIAQMVSDGGRKIKTIVAIAFDKGKYELGAPCGSCRHIINQFGNPWVIISKSKKVRLSDLYPLPVKT